jgi:hypothetical protein
VIVVVLPSIAQGLDESLRLACKGPDRRDETPSPFIGICLQEAVMLLVLVIVAAIGAGLSRAVLWLPVLLLGILLFLSVLIFTVPTDGIWWALGYGAASVLTLELSYLGAGFLFGRSERSASTSGVFRRDKHAHSKK